MLGCLPCGPKVCDSQKSAQSSESRGNAHSKFTRPRRNDALVSRLWRGFRREQKAPLLRAVRLGVCDDPDRERQANPQTYCNAAKKARRMITPAPSRCVCTHAHIGPSSADAGARTFSGSTEAAGLVAGSAVGKLVGRSGRDNPHPCAWQATRSTTDCADEKRSAAVALPGADRTGHSFEADRPQL